MSKFAIIDVETTGLSAANERITEIAIVLHDGTKVLDTFETLVNPERKISYRITALTGITNQMVKNAPFFYEVAKKIIEITEDCIFVAHNASFDYSFFRAEFNSLGYDYKRKTLCTAKLSRKLIPGLKSYSLGKLTKSLGIENKSAHRAGSDALATAELFQHLFSLQNEPEKIKKTDLSLLKQYEFIAKLPEKTGVYYFYDADNNLIYVGKAKKILSRVKQHFSNISSRSSLEMRNRITDIDFKVTGSELMALLLESHEIKTLKPLYNRALRRNSFSYGLFSHQLENGYLMLEAKRLSAKSEPIGSFLSSRDAKNYLYYLQEKYALCQKYLGLFKTNGACFQYGIKECRGACLAEEDAVDYNQRVEMAIAELQFDMPDFYILQEGRSEKEKAVISVKNGQFKGMGYILEDADVVHPEQLEDFIKSYPDNRDARQIIRTYIKTHRNLQIIAQ